MLSPVLLTALQARAFYFWPVIIVGAASGIIVFNFILVTWCLFCSSQRRVELQTQTIALPQPSSGKRVKFAESVKDSRNKYTSFPPPCVPSKLASAKVRTRRSDLPRAQNLFPQNLSSMSLMPTMIDHAPSVYSDDTASVYSAASAPLEAHDHLLRSHNSLNFITASSTPEITAVASLRDPDLLLSPRVGHRLSVMEEGLDPKAYNRAIQQRRQVLLSDPQQQSASCELSSDTSNRLLPPGILAPPPPIAKNIGQERSSMPMPSPYSPPSKW